MTGSPLPPPVLEGLVRRILGGGAADDFILGDLREEYARRPGPVRYALTGVAVALRVRAGRLAARASAVRTPSPTGMRPMSYSNGGTEMFSNVLTDLRLAARMLLRSPVPSAALVLTLAVGIGATTAVGSAVRGILLAPLPYDDPEELVVVEVNTGGLGWYGMSVPEYLDLAEELDAFDDVAGWVAGTLVLGDSLRPRRVGVAFATPRLLPVLGVDPAVGRSWTAEESLAGGGRVAVISESLASELFPGADAAGRSIRLTGSEYDVLGVMPEGFSFGGTDIDVWTPLGIDPQNPAPRANHFLTVVGRLAPSSHIAAAQAELDAYAARTRERYPESYAGRGFLTRMLPLHTWTVGATRTPLLVLLATAALVLLIACGNVANLLLARGEARVREMAVRSAVGAPRSRLVQQLLTEAAVLAAAGGLVGVVVAAVGIPALVRLAPAGTPRLDLVVLDLPMLLATVVLTALAGIAFGLIPAFRVGRGGAFNVEMGSRGMAGRGRRAVQIRRTLLVAQVAMAAVLTVGSVLMVRTLGNLYATDLGLATERIVTLTLDADPGRYADAETRMVLYDELLTRVAAVPGTDGVAVSCVAPMTQPCGYLSLIVEGREGVSIGDAPDGVREIVTPSYFDVLGIRAIAGRLFAGDDHAEAPLVAVVNQTFANTIWPGESAVGRRFRMFVDGWPYMEVIGVVADVRNRGPDTEADPTFYVPVQQAATSAYALPATSSLIVRASSPDPMALVAGIREAVRAVDPDIAVSRIRSLDDIVGGTVALRSFTLRLLQLFTLAALFLAAVGVYGVMTIAVGERRREIGLRKALGARGHSLVRRVVLEGVALGAIGCAIGLGGGLLLARWMSSLLFGVAAVDPATWILTAGVLVGAAALSSAVPAWRAGRTDPMVTLRAEV